MIVLTVVGALMLVMAPVFYNGYGNMPGRMPYAQLFLGLYFLVFLPGLIYFKCRKAFNAKNRITEHMAWTVDHEWIALKGESFESKMTWDKIHKVVETKEVFLVYQNKLMANIISKREMSREQLQGFRDVVKGVLQLKHTLRAD